VFFQRLLKNSFHGIPLAKTFLTPILERLMLAKTKALKKNPLTKAQTRLLKHSLKKLLGNGLIEDQKSVQQEDMKKMVLRNALNAIVLE
jgi:hypothetical protein